MSETLVLAIMNQTKPKISRDAFLYLDPSGPKAKEGEPYQDFAQCGACMMYTADWQKEGERLGGCTIIGTKKKTPIRGDIGSCGLFVPGPNHMEMAGKEMPLVTKKEAGYVDMPVRCENCGYYEESDSHCHLFMMLNQQMPMVWNLKEPVKAKGCCNAFVPGNKEYEQDNNNT